MLSLDLFRTLFNLDGLNIERVAFILSCCKNISLLYIFDHFVCKHK